VHAVAEEAGPRGEARAAWWGPAGVLLAALGLTAITLRPQLVGIGPLVPAIQDDLGLSHAVAGLLATIPVLCMGVLAPGAPAVLRVAGSRWAIAGSLALIALGGLGRAVAPGPAVLLAGTAVLGMGIGLAGALLPVVVKQGLPARPVIATAAYVFGMNLGAASASAGAVPLADATGGWRGTLLVFSLLTLAVLPAWLVCTRRLPRVRGGAVAPLRRAAGSQLAWVLVGVFTFMSIAFYGINAWLPDAYAERGWSEASAGGLVAVLNLCALPTTLLVPWLADRRGARRTYLVTGTLGLTTACVGLATVPALAFAWAVLFGLSIGSLFPLMMSLPVEVGRDPAGVGAVSGLMLGVGYCVSAAAPVALGALRDLTGSFDATLWALAASCALAVACGRLLTVQRLATGAV
jgi:MFS transporter, CP family, cyanate transporter